MLSNFGQMIRDARKARGLSQAEASRLCGLPQTTWTRYETGKNIPSGISLLKICSFLNISPSELGLDHISDPPVLQSFAAAKDPLKAVIVESFSGKDAAYISDSINEHCIKHNRIPVSVSLAWSPYGYFVALAVLRGGEA